MIKSGLTIALLIFCTAVSAKDLYVKDVIYITLRTGPGNQFSIIKTLKTGDILNLQEMSEDEKYAKVTTHDDKEGWVQMQYLSTTPIAALRLNAVENQLERYKKENNDMKSQLAEVNKELKVLSREKAKLSSQNKALEKQAAHIKEVSAKPIAIAEENEVLRTQNVTMQKEMQMVKQELQVMDDRRDREWFMIGGGVMAGGVLLGMLLPALGRRRKQGWSSL